ncbi:MAG: PsbP-related protein [Candidatus Nealsonbacteria bacterium]|nr:PsbP-related protein [Candidatus Nealsonbacteria bacterium]
MNQAFSKIWISIILTILIVGGFFAWQYFKAPKEEVKDETADWQTYRNEEYGFEMKYPQNWELEEESPPSPTADIIDVVKIWAPVSLESLEGKKEILPKEILSFFPTSITVTILKGWDLDNYISGAIEEESVFGPPKEIVKKERFDFIGNEAFEIEGKIFYSPESIYFLTGIKIEKSLDLHERERAIWKENNIYLIKGSVSEDKWDNYNDLITTVFQTFRFSE